MPHSARHIFLAGDRRRDRHAGLEALILPAPLHPALPVVDAHRRSRGPYTVAGTLMRALVPDALAQHPELVAAHEVEILTVAPELRDIVPANQETMTSLAVPSERTRFYSRMRTLRIAHGLRNFLDELLRLQQAGPRALAVDDLDHADPTDAEFVAVLLRRMDPAVLTVVVGGRAALLHPPSTPAAVEAGTPVGEPLHAALLRHCRQVECSVVEADAAEETDQAAALRYVAGDCRDDDPALLAAYTLLPEHERRQLHDARAQELAEHGEAPSLVLGAIPYHREHGTDPLGTGLEAMSDAMVSCVLHGFYDAVVDFCHRGRALTDWEETPDQRWTFTTLMPTAYSALGRIQEAEEICDEVRAHVRDPRKHMQMAYATSMLYTRHRSADRRDHERAAAWINEAIAISSLLPDAKSRAFSTVFHHNGLALIEAHRGRPLKALELVTAGMAALDRELGSGEQSLHRSVLRHNRAQVLTGLGRLEEALEEYRAVIEADPHYPEYHLDLGNLLQRMGRAAEAAAAYETATRLGPPFPELYYNRGDLRNGLGDVEGALADFGYVLDLDPTFLDAYVNRVGLLLDLEELDAAESDVLAGLALEPTHPMLLAALGRIRAERGEAETAWEAFDAALAADPDLVAALCGRATLAYEAGDAEGALEDLRRAVSLEPSNPATRYNRAFVLRSVGRWAEAVDDLDAAAREDPEDEEIAAALAECRAGMASGR